MAARNQARDRLDSDTPLPCACFILEGEMSAFLNLFRYLMAAILAPATFLWILAQHMNLIHEAFPDIVPNGDLWIRAQGLVQRPHGLVFFLSPLMLGLGVALLCLSVERDSTYRLFRPANIIRIRIGGACLGLTFMAALSEPAIYGALSHTDLRDLVLGNDPALFVLWLIGSWLSTLSVEGRTLFKHAEKLRGNLDQIV